MHARRPGPSTQTVEYAGRDRGCRASGESEPGEGDDRPRRSPDAMLAGRHADLPAASWTGDAELCEVLASLCHAESGHCGTVGATNWADQRHREARLLRSHRRFRVAEPFGFIRP